MTDVEVTSLFLCCFEHFDKSNVCKKWIMRHTFHNKKNICLGEIVSQIRV